MTNTEYTLLLTRVVNKMDQIDTSGFENPENGNKLVEALQQIANDVKEVVDLYNKEKV
jgi:hypothetical protein